VKALGHGRARATPLMVMPVRSLYPPQMFFTAGMPTGLAQWFKTVHVGVNDHGWAVVRIQV